MSLKAQVRAQRPRCHDGIGERMMRFRTFRVQVLAQILDDFEALGLWERF